MFKYLLYRFGQFLVNRMSLRAAYKMAEFLSTLQYYLSPRDQKAVKNNLRVILRNDADIPHLAQEVFINFGKYLVDFFRMVKNLNHTYIQEHVHIKNVHYLNEVLTKKKGGILLTAHIGNWELGGVVLAQLGYPLMAIALPHKERPVNDLFNSQRETLGVTVVQIKEAFRKCLATLDENKLIALLADRDFTLKGEVLDFLNKKTMIPKGAAVFSMKTGAPIIPCFFIRDTNDDFLFSFEEPLYPMKEKTEKETLLAIMKKYTAIIEKKIREVPTQWLMFRPFWIE